MGEINVCHLNAKQKIVSASSNIVTSLGGNEGNMSFINKSGHVCVLPCVCM